MMDVYTKSPNGQPNVPQNTELVYGKWMSKFDPILRGERGSPQLLEDEIDKKTDEKPKSSEASDATDSDMPSDWGQLVEIIYMLVRAICQKMKGEEAQDYEKESKDSREP